MKTSRPLLCALAVAAAALAGCGPSFDHLEFTNRTTPPDSTSVSENEIRIQVGIAIGVIATPYDGNEAMDDEDTTLELESDNPGVIGVDPALEHGSFVIYGVGAGTANVRIIVDGSDEGRIPATVTLQQ